MYWYYGYSLCIAFSSFEKNGGVHLHVETLPQKKARGRELIRNESEKILVCKIHVCCIEKRMRCVFGMYVSRFSGFLYRGLTSISNRFFRRLANDREGVMCIHI
jgi:hypothetical protein